MTGLIGVPSPCVSVCMVDETTNLCLGCCRTLEEIQQWWDLDDSAKQKVVDLAVARQVSVFD